MGLRYGALAVISAVITTRRAAKSRRWTKEGKVIMPRSYDTKRYFTLPYTTSLKGGSLNLLASARKPKSERALYRGQEELYM
ncbi:hypothetical protein BD311DRAFT_761169 [Dichomitus squalens]|uniref:Uncharacterized protein n=1 Tax=Dichomitus squalens TaxID=114155 RepID=A0A4Q9MK55_9APHY|nr:hypothetical protein BD311DRAFT_761169 [Dichomitus squalens]